MGQIRKILVANRGEIALRVMRTIRGLGLTSVGIYSEADKDAPHRQFADEVVALDGDLSSDTYLNIKKILAAAAATKADAIHPGYGFLSENAAFARAVARAGRIFIGPPASAIALMGNKAKAKRAMIVAGVPCVAGYQDKAQSDSALRAAALRIGYPLMVKAAEGGGGRGMRLVRQAKDLTSAIQIARSEAKSAFGSSELILEQAIMEARHVETQIFADAQGHVIHLGERDCSVQRRHQKIIEEAPCPVMTKTLRAQMGEAACAAARAIGYVGAGTVEFLLDKQKRFFFLEMNTRLQVEHPVTEAITGLDLVALQIQVADGQPLELAQSDITLRGAAMEARLYAEDPHKNFLPATGPILRFETPSQDGVRYDTGIVEGQNISSFYDPLLAKIISWGETRAQARDRLSQALRSMVLFGLPHNRDFLLDCLDHPTFAKGQATTNFIENAFTASSLQQGAPRASAQQLGAMAVLHYMIDAAQARAQIFGVTPSLRHFTNAPSLTSRYHLVSDGDTDGEAYPPCLVQTRHPHHYQVQYGAEHLIYHVVQEGEGSCRLHIGDTPLDCTYMLDHDRLHCTIAGRSFVMRQRMSAAGYTMDQARDGAVVAPMHGRVIAVFVKTGAKVKKGQRLAVMEAMKMQHEILAPMDGSIKAIHVKARQQIAVDTLIMDIT